MKYASSACILSILLSLLTVSLASASRELKQSCTIVRCGSNCVLDPSNPSGIRRWTCGACLPTYRLLSQRRACVCPPGTYEVGSRCVRCPVGFYCPAGNGNDFSNASISSVGTSGPFDLPPEGEGLGGKRSFRVPCGGNYTTRLAGSRDELACVAQPGHRYINGTGGEACPPNTYNPGFSRLTRCYSCPSGLTSVAGATSKFQCMLAAGFTMNRGVVVKCAQGTFRVGAVLPTEQTNCTRCIRGWTTEGPGSANPFDCNILLPGFFGPSSEGSTVAALPCPRHKYYPGGTPTQFCIDCPAAYVTRELQRDSDGLLVGYQTSTACVAPPGYYSDGIASMYRCPDNTYAVGWTRRTSCTSCGINIWSNLAHATIEDELVPGTGLLALASPNDCYIEAGMGMLFDRQAGQYRGFDCPINTYGTEKLSFGLKFTPCKPCPRGLYTPGPRMISPDNCTNLDGWGWDGFVAEVCPAGFYSAANRLTPCLPCPPNRNTTMRVTYPFFTDSPADLPLGSPPGDQQNDITDCKVVAGYGVIGNVAAATTPQLKVALDVMQCDVGFYSPGGQLDSTCTACPTLTTTADVGSTLITDCNLCFPGYGLGVGSVGNWSTQCTGCADGYYQPANNVTCLACGTTLSFTYQGKRDVVSGVGATTIPGTSFGVNSLPGAKNSDECLPWYYQMDESMGTHLRPYLYGTGTETNITSAAVCASRCDTTAGCFAATFVYANTLPGQESNTTGVCYIIMQGSSNIRLASKAVPLDFVSGSSVRSRQGGGGNGTDTAENAAMNGKSASVTTGQYVIWNGHPVGSMLGVAINGDSGVVMSVANCKSSCDSDSSCALFYHDGSRCYLRTGYEAEGARTFFNIVNSQIDLI